ncbi:hypothetical protein JMJ77_0001943 [Colletotrichum scovillei]|uniref:Uncharacterized protein n=1 Tax=Colletotrichum scovillei TaxID=1209932 RepID=A0A9P7UCT7_9PEZI|nr:hypothetical protein JMJ77_0001943 [Colletotrichum scovillei]
MQTLVDILVLRPESTYLGIQFFGNLGNVDITQQTTEFEMGTWNYSPQRLSVQRPISPGLRESNEDLTIPSQNAAYVCIVYLARSTDCSAL